MIDHKKSLDAENAKRAKVHYQFLSFSLIIINFYKKLKNKLHNLVRYYLSF